MRYQINDDDASHPTIASVPDDARGGATFSDAKAELIADIDSHIEHWRAMRRQMRKADAEPMPNRRDR